FNEKGFDESIYAQQVADHLQTDHHVIECNYEEGKSMIKDFCHYYDEPFSDSSAIPSMLLAKYTRQEVTVALSGDAGDESFIGYHRYNWIKKGQLINRIPLFLRKMCAAVLKQSSNYRLKTIASALTYKSTDDVYLAAMTSSLEARAPLLDYRVVEFARSLPTSFKFKGKNQKRILKEVLYKYVPKHIFDRPKAGFSMPFSEWFKTDLKDFVLSELSDEN